MKPALRKFAFALGIAAAFVGGAPSANAQCTSVLPLQPLAPLQKQSWQDPGRFDRSWLRSVSDGEADRDDRIVGLWRVIIASKGNGGIPDGTVLDRGFSQWHADGTEILNSSRPPVTQSFCLGTWKKVGPSKYVLNHFAISWDTNNNFAGLGNLRQEVQLSHDGSRFNGTVTIEQFDANGMNPLRINGVVTGQRIGVDTTVGDLI